ncbi:MAG: DUF4465 domain-containing protein [Paludibacteraceae bacterium]|nr:DUF4465 domain-containing protein [Paludibacteraceae bacterium]
MRKTLLLLPLLGYALALCAADTLTLDLGNYLSGYPQTADGCWKDTYNNDAHVEAGLFRFSHTGSLDAGDGMGYWDGFTLCTSGDNANYGSAGNSDGWVSRQWGCMAGGGLDNAFNVKAGAPYLVAYWGYWDETFDATYHSLRIDFTDKRPHKAVGVYICNHPWPYYGNENGDGFASAFTKEGDYFGLVAHGLNEQGESTGTEVRLALAEYRNGALVQSADWQWLDLTVLGTVSGLYFTMETSDKDAKWGANTAVFFCMDKLRVLPYTEQQVPSRPTGLKATAGAEDSVVLTWNKTAGAASYKLYCNDTPAGTTADTLFVFRGLKAGTEYRLAVEAVSAGGTSDKAAVAVTTADLTAPSAPEGLTAQPELRAMTLSWQPAADNVGVVRYSVYVDGEVQKRVKNGTSCRLTGLDPATRYCFAVEAEDAAGNKSARTTIEAFTLSDKPSALTGLEAGETLRGVYRTDGTVVGTGLHLSRGIYIVLTDKRTYKIIIP